MSVDKDEVNRVKRFLVGKKCNHCQVGHYTYFIKSLNEIRCINCASSPFEAKNKTNK